MSRSYPFRSRRSNVLARHGVVAASQPLAAQAGLNVLQQGGNAVDAAVAAAVTLNVVEPMSTGIGGDLFALVWLAKEKKLRALNASGRSPYAATVERVRALGHKVMPVTGMLSVTIPGAPDGWETLVRACGRLPLDKVMAPAIGYAEEGFPVSEVIAGNWAAGEAKLAAHPASAAAYLVNGRAPRWGEIFRQPELARTLHAVAEGGAQAFYQGEIAEKIVAFSQANGGLFALQDFAEHTSTWEEPISTEYHGVRLYECPPNGQGLVALIALNLLAGYDLKAIGHNSPQYLHLVVEALKLAFADAHYHVTDPTQYHVPVEKLLSMRYAAERRKLISLEQAAGVRHTGIPKQGDTIYLCAADGEGNVCSLINSLYHGFGSGMVVEGTGIALQNRGNSFSLDPKRPNHLAPHKRPYHTIIPAMIMKDEKPLYAYGVMGGHMQPQGHVQVLLNLVDFGLSPQEALDAARVYWDAGKNIMIEPELGEATREALIGMGHEVAPFSRVSMGNFGGGQVIRIGPESGVLCAGSEPRKDGCAAGY
jgi:gamma-glutamyltranspeptidase/glutathione hydrolase